MSATASVASRRFAPDRPRRVVVIAGEDAAPEAVHPTVELIDRLGLEIEWLWPAVGEEGLVREGSDFPDRARDAIDSCDAVLFGATNGASARALFHLRWGKQTYANVRPARWFPGCASPLAHPEGIDFVIVRENLEDLYVGVEGDLGALDAAGPLGKRSFAAPQGVAALAPGRFALKVITERGTERVVRFAFELARARSAAGRPGKVTCSSKYNMLPRTDGLFRDIAAQVARSYPDIAFETFIVDDFARRLVATPHDIDVAVLPNLYGDVLSDAAAGVVGGLGLAPSGCYGDGFAYFEPAHGSAPDIAGRGIINPTAMILSAAMMLDYLGFGEAARRLEAAVEAVYAAGESLTPDQGGRGRTSDLCAAVASRL